MCISDQRKSTFWFICNNHLEELWHDEYLPYHRESNAVPLVAQIFSLQLSKTAILQTLAPRCYISSSQKALQFNCMNPAVKLSTSWYFLGIALNLGSLWTIKSVELFISVSFLSLLLGCWEFNCFYFQYPLCQVNIERKFFLNNYRHITARTNFSSHSYIYCNCKKFLCWNSKNFIYYKADVKGTLMSLYTKMSYIFALLAVTIG